MCDAMKSNPQAYFTTPSNIPQNLNIAGGQAAKDKYVKNVNAAFARGLNKIKVLAKDEYFGNDGAKKVVVELEKILLNSKKISTQVGITCVLTTPEACIVRTSAVEGKKLVDDVKKIVDDFIEIEALVQFQDGVDQFGWAFYLLPVAAFLTTLFFTTCWVVISHRDYRCGFNKRCCCALLVNELCSPFWLINFLLADILTAVVGFFLFDMHDGIKFELNKKDVSLKVLFDHIKANYPDFWKPFKPFEDNGPPMFVIGVFMLWIGLSILCQGIVICICCPYKQQDSDELEENEVIGKDNEEQWPQ
jgi:hypothetical protein